jgi:hypothetical protein
MEEYSNWEEKIAKLQYERDSTLKFMLSNKEISKSQYKKRVAEIFNSISYLIENKPPLPQQIVEERKKKSIKTLNMMHMLCLAAQQ